MGAGLLYGSPNTYLSPDYYSTGARLAVWIEREIPSFVGNVPAKYTEALSAVLQKHNVPASIIREAFLILEKKGIRFDGGFGILPPPPPINTRGVPPAPQMKGISKGEAERIKRYTFEEYERRYVLAIKTNDFAGAEAILAAVLTLLWGMAKGYASMRKDARREPTVEWEEFNTAVNEALDRARTLETHVRTLSREEINSFRHVPRPDYEASQLAKRVITRTVRPARARRRARK